MKCLDPNSPRKTTKRLGVKVIKQNYLYSLLFFGAIEDICLKLVGIS